MARLYTMTLKQLLLDFGLMLKDAVLLKVTTQGNPNEATIAKLASGVADTYLGSEFFLWTPPAGMTAENPLIVKSSGVDGKLTFTEAVGPTAVAAGTYGVLQNIGGKGHPQALKEQALRMALLDSKEQYFTSIQLLTPSPLTPWQAIPQGVSSIYKVVINDGFDEFEVSPRTWNDIDLDGRRIYLPYDFNVSGRSVTFYGRSDITYPWAGTTDYDQTINVDAPRLLKDAHVWLLLNHRDDKSAQVVANMYNDRVRTRRNLPLPGEVFLN